MSDIKIHRAHSMPHTKARKEAERIAVELKEKFGLDWEWNGDQIHFHRQGVSGILAVGKDAVQLEAKLGMLLAFLKPTIESHINANLDKVFAPAEKPATKPAKKR